MWEWNTYSTNSFDNLSLPLDPGDPGSPGGPGKPGTPGVPMTPISPLEPRKQIGWEKITPCFYFHDSKTQNKGNGVVEVGPSFVSKQKIVILKSLTVENW